MKLLPIPLLFTMALLVDEEPTSFTKYTQTIPGSNVKFDMMPIPGGTYLQGSLLTESHRALWPVS